MSDFARMYQWGLGSLCLLAMLGIGRADTIQLSSGQSVTATVTRYKNHAFEARGADGKTTTYPANSVKRIAFEAHPASSKLTTRTNGVQEGTITAFENGSFAMTQPGGARNFSAIFVEQAEFVADRGQSVQVITHGAQVDLKQHLALGNVTIVDFYADWCGPCKMLYPTIEQLVNSDPEIAVRKIDIIDWESAVSKQYGIHAIPHVEIYDRKGKLVGTVKGVDPEELKRFVAQAKRS